MPRREGTDTVSRHMNPTTRGTIAILLMVFYCWMCAADALGADALPATSATRASTPPAETHEHPTSGQLAFPGAEGYGRFARGGRGGKVYEVTTLDDYLVDKQHPENSEPVIHGSLREAVEAQGPRTIV